MKTLIKNIELKKISLVLLTLGAVTLAGCSGGSGQEVQQNVDDSDPDNNGGIVYNGPSPQTDDVQNFKVNVWDNLAGEDRCGACHVEGGQSPQFVRHDDVNLAYQAANTIVDLSAPALSLMVTKVAEGHNCWRPEASVCADTITNYIAAWGSDSGAEANEIVLTAPPIRSVADSRNFPSDPTDPGISANDSFQNTVYPLLTAYCASCHSEDAITMQQPFFGSSDLEVAYDAARSRINLDDPATSRFVTRLGQEAHNCWSSCASDAQTMTNAITAFANSIELTSVDPNLVVSAALGLPDGVVASSGGRVEANVIALYQFKTGTGPTVYDTSGVDPAMDLNRSGNTSWVGSWGLRIVDGKAQASTASSRKLYDLITSTGEFAIETWVVPDNVAQDGPARIVTYSGDGETENRNFTLGQTLYNYNFLSRTTEEAVSEVSMLSTPDADEVLQATLQHVVANFDPINGRTIYVNGELVAQDAVGGNMNDWDDTYAFAIGNEVNNMELFQGTIRLLAIHNRTLDEAAIAANFAAGVGQKFFLLFNVEAHTGMAQSYVVFQVEVFDDYSYLFSAPFFISLDETATPSGDIPIQGIRIGVNGREASLGQSFANIDFTVNASNYSPDGVSLSSLGAIIAQEKGADEDVFFLTFDRIGTASYSRVEEDPAAPPTPADLPEQSDIGVRHFGEISATISSITGVPQTAVADTFELVKQQLPTAEAIDGFLAAHQAGVMQMSVAYCTALVSNTSYRNALFPNFDFGGAYNASTRDDIIDPLIEALLLHDIDVGGSTQTLTTQPAQADVRTRLEELGDDVSSANTQTAVIATCAAAVGNAAMLLQ